MHTHFLLHPRTHRRPPSSRECISFPLSSSQNTLVARHCLSAFPWRHIRAKVCALRRAGSNETRKRRSNTLHETCSIYQRLGDAPARVLGTCIFAFDTGMGTDNVGKYGKETNRACERNETFARTKFVTSLSIRQWQRSTVFLKKSNRFQKKITKISYNRVRLKLILHIQIFFF